MRKTNHLHELVKAVKLLLAHTLICLLALLPSIIFAHSCLASVTDNASVSDPKKASKVWYYKYDKSKILEASIGTKSQTRISFRPYTIKEVVGDCNKYKLISSNGGSYVFMAPKAKEGEKIDITIITSSGKAQDISLKITEGYGKSIIILDEAVHTKYQQELLEEAKLMIKSMVKGKKSKYDVTSITDKSILFKAKDPDIEINKTALFRYDLYNLIGLVINIKNIGKDKIECEDISLKNLFNNPLLISFSYPPNTELTQTKCIIDKAGSHRAYIVMQDDLEGRV